MSHLGNHNVWWGYGKETFSVRKNKGEIEVTRPTVTCTIEKLEEDGSKVEVATHKVRLHHKDVNNKLVGREFAFRGAVKNIVDRVTRHNIRKDFHETVRHVVNG